MNCKLEFALLVAMACASTQSFAGRNCDAAVPPAPQQIVQGLNLAERTLRALEADYVKNQTVVVLLGRVGQDLSKYGVTYSHLGFAFRQNDGRWQVTHKLNTCGTAEASLYRQGLGEFFLDDLFRYEAGWVVPRKEVQERLHAVLLNDAKASAINVKPYNMVSYAWGTKYQQSNQWALETLAYAMDDSIKTREQSQAWLKFKGYEPTTLILGPLTRLGGRTTQANIAFDDHPASKRFSDRIETVTVDSVFRWLQLSGMSGAPVLQR